MVLSLQLEARCFGGAGRVFLFLEQAIFSLQSSSRACCWWWYWHATMAGGVEVAHCVQEMALHTSIPCLQVSVVLLELDL